MEQPAEEYLTLEQLAEPLNYSRKTIQNKIATGVFKKGVHFSTAPGLPTLFRWSAIIAMYDWSDPGPEQARESSRGPGQMARKYSIG
jgi:hypothetical protein